MENGMACFVRCRLWLLSLLWLAALSSTLAAQPLDQLFQNVQASDDRARALLIDGYARSPIFRHLVTDLESSD
jgi:hypothetical protein